MADKKKPTTKKKLTTRETGRSRTMEAASGVPGPAEFRGRSVRAPLESMFAPLGVAHPRQIWIPMSPADLATAIALSRGQRTFVRSGIVATTTETVDAGGGIVIQLTELNEVDVKGDVVHAYAGATVEAVSARLFEHGLALPLSDVPSLSVASNVLNEGPSPLMRTLGALSDYVTRVKGVTADAGAIVRNGPKALARVVEAEAVLGAVEFTPAQADDLWMERRTMPYPGREAFLALTRALFVGTTIPERSDVVLDALNVRHDLSLIRITGSGGQADDRTAVVALVGRAMANLPAELAGEVIAEGYVGRDVIRSVMDAGFDVAADPVLRTERFDQVVAPNTDLGELLSRVADDVDRALAWRTDGTGEVDPDLHIVARVQLDRDDRVRLSGFVFSARPSASWGPELAALVPRTRPVRVVHRDFEVFPTMAPRIPGFEGEVFLPSDPSYAARAHQYATTSYPPARTRPFMVAYPLHEPDIQAALAFARQQGKKVVARSGGHQYTAKSSGGDDTIVLSMEAFAELFPVSPTVVEVGPGVMLTRLARELRGRGITIPHGECPRVCVGGHAQTGGYGHLARAFGLALDHVKAFRIVLADGTIRDVSRPADAPATADDELFWGVLGGNAGSFGIVTRYTFECVRDADHPDSFGYSAVRRYSRARYMTLMAEVQEWTRQVAADTLLPDIDFMMTVESAWKPGLPPLLLVELVHSDLGGPKDPDMGHPRFVPIIDAAETGAGVWRAFTIRGRKPLSFWSDHFVRRPPGTTADGREFRYPYKKRVNCTVSALSDAFVDGFVDLIDEVVEDTPGVHLVFQMLIGGGNFRHSRRRPETSIPQRDYVFCFVFDLFYDVGRDGAAEALQARMQALIDAAYNDGRERRVFWGTFGETDITDQATRDMYYDDPAVYARLRALKHAIDPNDLFHTSLTVK
ncbi:MAG: FAD-binding protein [Myxococcota bacterium]